MDALNRILKKAMQRKKKIALPEAGLDPRMPGAARLVADKGWANPILVGAEAAVKKNAAENQVAIGDLALIDHMLSGEREDFAREYNVLRKKENLSLEQALELMNNPLYFGVMLVRQGRADGMVAGAYHATADVLRPALKIIGLAEGIQTMSSTFIMTVPNSPFGEEGTLLFADPAIIPAPTAEQLADIAIATAATARSLFDYEPRIAMLSFSTYGSAQHEQVDKVRLATALVRSRRPDLLIDGELQADAALVASVGAKKCPGSPVAGRANILIFPDLNAANIGYKLVQRLANAIAIGPVSQGLALPVNDLSRGVTVEEIAATIAITAAMA